MSNTFSLDLLNRCVLLQQSITGTKVALPRFWAPIGNNPFPVWYNGISSVVTDPTVGLPLRRRLYTVRMRVILGGLSNGYQGEHEDAGNRVMSEVIDVFDQERKLGYGALGALRYVDKSNLRDLQNGVQPFDYSEVSGSPLFYIGIEYTLEVTATFNVGRNS